MGGSEAQSGGLVWMQHPRQGGAEGIQRGGRGGGVKEEKGEGEPNRGGHTMIHHPSLISDENDGDDEVEYDYNSEGGGGGERGTYSSSNWPRNRRRT